MNTKPALQLPGGVNYLLLM